MRDAPAILIAAGQALYGERWQSPLARDLGTTYRTIRYWVDGRYAPPADLMERLADLLRRRGKDIDTVLRRISEKNERG